MASRLQVIQATPGLEAVRTLLERQRRGDVTLVTAFSGARVGALRGLDDPTLEVMDFGQVVGHCLSRLGGHPIGLPNQGHLRAALAQACEDLPESSPFAQTSMTPGFQRYALRLLDDLRAYGLEADELRSAAEHAHPDLSAKLSDLARLQASVAEAMTMLGKRFNRERMEVCYDFEEGDLDLDLVVWAGSDDAPLALDWLKWAAERGARVTVVVEAHPTNAELFKGAQTIAEKLGTSPMLLPVANRLTARLFAGAPYEGNARDLEVGITVAPDQLAEVEWAVRMVLDELAAGTEPSRIAVVTRNLADYAPLLESAAKRLGLPLVCGRSVPLMANGLVRFIVDLLQSLVSRDVRALLPLIRSSYLQMPRRALGELESVIREAHRVRSNEWGALEEAMRSQIAPESAAWLLPVLEWRTESRSQQRALDEWAERVRDLADQSWLAAALEANTPTQERDTYAQNALQRTLADAATMERLRGGRSRSFDSFVREAIRLWDGVEVTLPLDPGGVAVVNSGEALGEVEVVCVLGMLEGVFPRRRSENPILHDEDLQWLSGYFGITLPDSHRRAHEERDEFYRVVCAPSRRLVLSYPQTGEERDNVPAFYLQEVRRLTDAPESVYSRRQFVPDQPKAEADVRLAAALAEPRQKPTPLEITLDEAREAIGRGPDEAFSVRELVHVLQCPFRYMASSRLRLNAPRTASRWNRLLNLPQMAGLASQPDAESASARLLEELDNMLTDLYSDSTHADLALMRAGGHRLVKEWVEREFAARASWPRDEVIKHGVEFDDELLRATIKLESGQVIRMRGEFPAMTVQQGVRVLHLFRQDDPVKKGDGVFESMSEEDRLELGLALLAIRPPNLPSAIELDCAAKGTRRMIYRGGQTHFRQDGGVLTCSTFEEDDKRTLRKSVVEQLEEATRLVGEGRITARPSDQCTRCEFGEMCRRSREYSDERDPFDFRGAVHES